MRTITAAFDVDQTLLANDDHLNPTPGNLVANEVVRSLLVALACMRNVDVYVWSGGGVVYARQVVQTLGLLPYVKDVVLKGSFEPDMCFDDMPDTMLATLNIIVAGDDDYDDKPDKSFKDGVRESMLILSKYGKLGDIPQEAFDELKQILNQNALQGEEKESQRPF